MESNGVRTKGHAFGEGFSNGEQHYSLVGKGPSTWRRVEEDEAAGRICKYSVRSVYKGIRLHNFLKT